MSGYALCLQCQLDKHIKFNGIAHRPEPCHAIISSRQLAAGVVQTQRTSWIRDAMTVYSSVAQTFLAKGPKTKF